MIIPTPLPEMDEQSAEFDAFQDWLADRYPSGIHPVYMGGMLAIILSKMRIYYGPIELARLIARVMKHMDELTVQNGGVLYEHLVATGDPAQALQDLATLSSGNIEPEHFTG